MTISETSRHGRGRYWRLLPVAACAVVVAVILGALAPDRRAPAGGGGSGPAAAGVDAGRGARVAASRNAAPTPTEASLRLQSLLGQHSVLAADMMRGRLRGDPDLAQAANAALGKNTDAVGGLVGALFGDQAKNQFTTLWAGHVAALFNYARGVADKDAAVRRQAIASVTKFEGDLAGFFSAASQGRLPRAVAASAVKTHIDHLLRQADAYAAGNYPLSDRVYRESYTHAFGLGMALASTLLPPTAARALTAPSWRLRSELDRLLGEYVVLVVAAMRAGATDAANFRTAAATADANTRDLAGAMDALFGQAAARRFQSLWADHVDALVAYSGAVAKSDDAQRATAGQQLSTFEAKLAQFLRAATRDRMAATTLARALRTHDQTLLQEADAYAAKDYRRAHDIAYSTYEQMFELARQLSEAFGDTVAARMPTGGVQTGSGGMATVVERRGHGS